MKNIKKIVIFLGIILLLNISNVMAENIPISIQSDEGNIATVKLSTQETIGVISGKIECSSEITNIEVKGKNSWIALYNAETKQFTICKGEGAREEDFMEIIYTVEDTNENAQITLKELKMTTLQYETIEIPNEVTEEIEIQEDNIEEDYEDEEDEEDGEYEEYEKDEEQTTNKWIIIAIIIVVILILGIIVFYFFRKKKIQ